MAKSIEYSVNIPVIGKYDTVVIGGGPAGCCAAIEAARDGAKVLLIESTGSLGGMATSGMVGPLMTSYDRDGNRPLVGGLYREIVQRLSACGGVIPPEETDSPSIHTSFIKPYHRHVTPFSSFSMELVLDEMTEEAGVDVMMYTGFVDCVCENGHISRVILAALEGLRAVEADLFIDCTGRADVADKAGVPTWKGDENTGIPQPGTLMFKVDNVDDDRYTARPKYPVKAYRTPIKGQYTVNHEHVYSVDAADSRSMTQAHREARRQVVESLRVLKEETPGFVNSELIAVAPVLGVRESRHIEGRYRITVEDVAGGTLFPDRIAAYGFGMDVHTRNSETAGGKNFVVEIAEAYYVPFRSMQPVNCDNLLVAGKTISCCSQAAGGLRCMPCAMAMGQAAGAACALAHRDSVLPEQVDIAELQALLREHGAILD